MTNVNFSYEILYFLPRLLKETYVKAMDNKIRAIHPVSVVISYKFIPFCC
jgi:hypothetical protein